MNTLIYSTGWKGHQEISALEWADVCAERGDNVFYLSCDISLGGCCDNYLFNKTYCRICKQFQKKNFNKYVRKKGNDIQQHFVSEFITNDILAVSNQITFNYNSVTELKNVTFHGVEIGYGAFSSYVSLTRNISPLFSKEFKSYIDSILKSEVILTLIVENIIDAHNIDLVINHNSRFAQFKPLTGVAKQKNIQFVNTEAFAFQDGRLAMNDFMNTTPHDVHFITHIIQTDWDDSDIHQREQIAKSFFENRRYGKFSGDNNYILFQKSGQLPDGWDNSKDNIVIYNSSEDEFCSLSPFYDSNRLFVTQYDGLIAIFEHYKNDTSKHFYLRIHPNLGGVKYKFHTDLYKLNYPNVTVIGATSPISTYSIMDAANKVIVFGSTTGVEAVYWGKPVISLAVIYYSLLNITYSPKTTDELWTLLDKTDLKCLYNENVLKYGFWIMKQNYPQYKHIPLKIKNVGWTFVFSAYKFLGSSMLYAILFAALRKLSAKIGLTSRFKKLPLEEN